MEAGLAAVLQKASGGSVWRPHLYAGKYSAVCGVFQRKKYADGLREACEFKIQIWKSQLLVSGIFCGYSRKNAKKIEEYIANQLQEDKMFDQLSMKEYIDPFTGEPVKTNKK